MLVIWVFGVLKLSNGLVILLYFLLFCGHSRIASLFGLYILKTVTSITNLSRQMLIARFLSNIKVFYRDLPVNIDLLSLRLSSISHIFDCFSSFFCLLLSAFYNFVNYGIFSIMLFLLRISKSGASLTYALLFYSQKAWWRSVFWPQSFMFIVLISHLHVISLSHVGLIHILGIHI